MKLYEALNQYDKKTLLNLGKVYGLKGGYKLKKAELTQALAQTMCHNIHKGLELLSTEDYQCFMRLTQVKEEPIQIETLGACRTLLVLGLIYISEKKVVQVLPELKQAFSDMKNDLNIVRALKERHLLADKVRAYRKAAMQLYGMMPVYDFLMMYKQYEGLDEKQAAEIEQVLEILWGDCEIYCHAYLEDDYLLDDSFSCVDPEEIDYFKEQIKGKPYYRPNRDTFLLYSDEEYYEQTLELQAVKKFLNDKFPLQHEKIDAILSDWYLDTSIELLPNTDFLSPILDKLACFDLELKEFKDIEQLAGLLMKANNKVRMWINRGYSPQEIRSLMAKQRSEVKLGRNDPCPCGSGKKYKKCCGK